MRNSIIENIPKDFKLPIIISIILVISFVIRIYYTPFGVLLSLDSSVYFYYTLSILELNKIPEGVIMTNDGWSFFLIPFFYLMNSNDLIQLMNIQRVISVIISTISFIPISIHNWEFIFRSWWVVIIICIQYFISYDFFLWKIQKFSRFCFNCNYVNNKIRSIIDFYSICNYNDFPSEKN